MSGAGGYILCLAKYAATRDTLAACARRNKSERRAIAQGLQECKGRAVGRHLVADGQVDDPARDHAARVRLHNIHELAVYEVDGSRAILNGEGQSPPCYAPWSPCRRRPQSSTRRS